MNININGKDIVVDLDGDTPLLWVIRDELNYTGTKFGCGMALCGACTIHIDGRPTRSCSFPLKAAEGRKLTTIEGVIDSDQVARAVVAAWEDNSVPQCGRMCSSRMGPEVLATIVPPPKTRRSKERPVMMSPPR